ncbi:MAG: hypothetical protein UU05_C0025G0005 [Candidatus Curtissbacteria bacterium GW2011_GWA1_40_47]|nr:MAG: hypothetical protein UU05_C0025G0005 [Candidatus Curtissbacteria bacterium GW2011_GWA1_40_47]
MKKDLLKQIEKIHSWKLPVKHYCKPYRPFYKPNFVFWLIAILALVIWLICERNFIRAVAFSYFLIGALSDLFTNFLIGNIWSKQSLKNVNTVDTSLIGDLKQVSWLPRTVGIFERIIFTTSFIIGRYEFAAVWLGLKVIGSWKDSSDSANKDKKNEDVPKIKLWRIRENIFLIGTAMSLILSFIAAVGFLEIISQKNLIYDYLQKLPSKYTLF